MSVRDWKFHDYDMLLDSYVKVPYGPRGRIVARAFPVVYSLTNLARGSYCQVFSPTGDEKKSWTRKTRNEGKLGSTRYTVYDNLDAALEAGIKWARRKDEERAEEGRK